MEGEWPKRAGQIALGWVDPGEQDPGLQSVSELSWIQNWREPWCWREQAALERDVCKNPKTKSGLSWGVRSGLYEDFFLKVATKLWLISKIFIHRTKVLGEFIKRWKHEYLVSLRERAQAQHRESGVRVGQIVQIYEDLTPRVNWRLARITKLFTGSDGHVRSVEVKLLPGPL